MTKSRGLFPRGAEWRLWDLHVHTPASFHWEGQHFDPDPASPTNTRLIDDMIGAMNAATPAVFAVMDYWTFDGWFALKRRLKQPGAPALRKTVFPGIELRLAAPTRCRLNAHVLFSDQTPEQTLVDFRAALLVEIVSRPLSDASLRELARTVGSDLLRKHGFRKADVDSDDQMALKAGATIAEINCDSYKSAITKVPNGHAVGFMPYDTSDGLDEVKWHEHYAYFLGLFQSSPIFETRNLDLRGAFVDEVTPGNSAWLKHFRHGLKEISRLAVSGSDAHRFIGVPGDNDRRGYGDFPSGKATWIKADPTFLGLLQAIKEPSRRSFIGKLPPKLVEMEANRTFFIDSIKISKNAGSTLPGDWLSNCELPLSGDLVAIIGNKGSGKSALADVIALLGNSQQVGEFSFLSPKRFRKKPIELAKHFTGHILWRDQSPQSRLLSEDPPVESVELVRYIPQTHFEKLCNDHVTGRSREFEKELRDVIFAHTSPSIRQKALDFDQLVEQQESTVRDHLGELRKDLRKLNQEIEGIESQLQPEVQRSLLELIALKEKQIEEHFKNRSKLEPKPADGLSEEQQQASQELEAIAQKLDLLAEKAPITANQQAQLAAKLKAIQSVRERLQLLKRQFKQFQEETSEDLRILGVNNAEIASLTFHEEMLDQLAAPIPENLKALADMVEADALEKQRLLDSQANANAKLNAPQQKYEQCLRARSAWRAKLRELRGADDAPDTLLGLKARLAQLQSLPVALAERGAKRIELSGEIFDVLESQRKTREDLFKPVQDVIQANTLIRDEYKLQFQAVIHGSPEALAAALFELVKQTSGEFRGEEESHAALKRIAENYDLSSRAGVLSFVTELHNHLVAAANGDRGAAVGIAGLLRTTKATVNKAPVDVYDLLFGLSFLETRYSLLFQDTQIEQLSPGQRGALLLIFYLLVDKGRNPIILDQPEENLDNETVFNLLVPVLSEAKRKRQVLMVTHNPNLAVVCDAEQVIYSEFDRKNASRIAYVSGSIEDPIMNKHVIDVLEGTKPAFENRKRKYH